MARAMRSLAVALLLTLIVLSARRAQAQPALDVAALHDEQDLRGRVALYLERAAANTLPEVQTKQSAFAPADGSSINLGLQRGALWVRATVRNDSSRSVRWVLEIAEPTLEHVELHVVRRGDRSESFFSGTAVPFPARAIGHANHVFELESPPHDEAEVFLRIRSDFVLRAPLRAWTPVAYRAHHDAVLLLQALAIGALALVALYHLGTFWVARQVENVWFACTMLAFCAVEMSRTGLAAQFVLPRSPELVLRLLGVTTALAVSSVAFFTYAITKQMKSEPALTRVLFVAALATLPLLGLALLAPLGLVGRALVATLLLSTVLGPFLLHKARKRHRLPSMPLYWIAWYALIVPLFVLMLRYSGFWPDGLVGDWILPVGFVTYATANSVAFAAVASRLRGELGGENLLLVYDVAELKRALQRAEDATRAKDDFMATMSHELRTPLNAIINLPEGLIEKFVTQRSASCRRCDAAYLLDDGERIDARTVCESCAGVGQLVEGTTVQYGGDHAHALRFLRKIERAGRNLLQLVNGVLDFTKLDAGQFVLTLGTVDLEALLHEVREDLLELAQAREISIEVHAGTHGDTLVSADGPRLKQVLLNLVGNAIKFSKRAGSVTLRLRSTHEHAFIEVEDRGIGIAPEDHERIFARFEQVDRGDTRKYGGTGLGLSIAQALVRLHGGELSVRSELGKGATFTVDLPRMPVDVAREARSAQS